jgi:hypothetical protein
MKTEELGKFLETREPVAWIDGVPWGVANRVLAPLCPPHLMKPVAREAVRGALAASRAILARWNTSWNVAPCEWWWIGCDDAAYDMATFGRKPRYNVRLGLRNCEVRRVELPWFVENAYPVYASAFTRYVRGTRRLSREEFVRFPRYQIPGCEAWGAFAGGKLIAYYTCIPLDDCVFYDEARFDPEQRTLHPNNALVYTLTHHYLHERQFAYVHAGNRAVGHPTHVQDFYETMGFRRIYATLQTEVSGLAKFVLATKVDRWGALAGLNFLAPELMQGIRGVASMVSYAKACESAGAPALRPET